MGDRGGENDDTRRSPSVTGMSGLVLRVRRNSLRPARPARCCRLGFANAEAVAGDRNEPEGTIYVELEGDGQVTPDAERSEAVERDNCRMVAVVTDFFVGALLTGEFSLKPGWSSTGVESIVLRTSSCLFDKSCRPVDARHCSGVARGGEKASDAGSEGSGMDPLRSVPLRSVAGGPSDADRR